MTPPPARATRRLAKAAELVGGLARGRPTDWPRAPGCPTDWPRAPGCPTDWPRAPGAALVRHYLDPSRRTLRGRAWSLRHREGQQANCRRFVAPVIGEVALPQLSRTHIARVLGAAPTASVASHLRRCLTAMVARRTGGGAAPGQPGRAAGGALAGPRR